MAWSFAVAILARACSVMPEGWQRKGRSRRWRKNIMETTALVFNTLNTTMLALLVYLNLINMDRKGKP